MKYVRLALLATSVNLRRMFSKMASSASDIAVRNAVGNEFILSETVFAFLNSGTRVLLVNLNPAGMPMYIAAITRIDTTMKTTCKTRRLTFKYDDGVIFEQCHLSSSRDVINPKTGHIGRSEQLCDS